MNRREFVKLAPAFPAAAVSATLVVREEGKEPINCDVSVLKCQPGDTLVLKCGGLITADRAVRMTASIENLFDNRVRVMILDSSMSLEGVLRT